MIDQEQKGSGREMKDKTAEYLYKCRNCGKVYSGCESGTAREPIFHLIDAIHKVVVNNQAPIAMVESHLCSKTNGGIADLIGYRIV